MGGPTLKASRFGWLAPPLALAALCGLVPHMVGFNQYYILVATRIAIVASVALSWNIIGGLAGQLDLASSAYLGLGGILAAELMIKYGVTPWIGMLAGAAASAGVAFLIGYPLFRFGIREVWYALSTVALVVVLHELAIVLMGPFDYYVPPVEGWYYLRFRTWENLYYVSLVLLAFVIVVNLWVSRSKLGYYLKAIREDETAAEALGVDVRKYKLLALLIYATLVGFAGYLYVVTQRTYSYKTFSAPFSIYIAVIGIVGGLGSVDGILLAAAMLGMAEEYLRATFGGTLPGLHLLVYGLLLVTVGVLRPEGLATVTRRLLRPVRTRFLGGESA